MQIPGTPNRESTNDDDIDNNDNDHSLNRMRREAISELI